MNEKQKKTFKYLVTMRWYVETDEEFNKWIEEQSVNKISNL